MAVSQPALTERREGEKDRSSSPLVKNLHDSVRREGTLLGALQLGTGTLSPCYTSPGSKTRIRNNPSLVSKHGQGPALAQGAPKSSSSGAPGGTNTGDTALPPCPRQTQRDTNPPWPPGAALVISCSILPRLGFPPVPQGRCLSRRRHGLSCLEEKLVLSLQKGKSTSGREGRREGDLQANTELMRTTSKLPK